MENSMSDQSSLQPGTLPHVVVVINEGGWPYRVFGPFDYQTARRHAQDVLETVSTTMPKTGQTWQRWLEDNDGWRFDNGSGVYIHELTKDFSTRWKGIVDWRHTKMTAEGSFRASKEG
jgi:hypothetical protein